ncbi:hypothetical protein [Pseudobacteriovorax antillogorgiicola]|uniref:Uncharacterized protein n=1 Tax=Pseudobacteriovorax antillogorgiicola TaxID=1513793 RepID=A0A1Y6BNG1_9BACT|nr:hypothetical protein [Pseudobacteriovorax antillogorgiicola]TCS54511.1 hypothetical protein EDD56_10624 [Pseudobacteriovorax antillogorgiicola]SMF18945.1 hypothetical protein SAMN06296036_106219 [Pseudobacteriovorax antillogorgiicola]
MNKISKSIILSSFMAHTAFATSWNFNSTTLCKLHYSSTAYGKEVESVVAHTGLYTEKGSYTGIPSGVFFWSDIQDISLDRKDPSSPLVGNVVLSGSGGQWRDTVLYPVVQYFVTFNDGSSLISNVHEIEIIKEISSRDYREYTKSIEKLNNEFLGSSPITRTECVEASIYRAS